MRSYYLLIAFLLPHFLYAQVHWKKMEKSSPLTFAFRIYAKDAEKFFHNDSIPVDEFLNKPPDYILSTRDQNTDNFSTGMYVLINSNDDVIHAYIICVTKIMAYTINNLNRVQIAVRDSAGNPLQASVWANNKKAAYDKNAATFWIKQNTPEEALIKIYTTDDTTYLTLSGNEDFDESVWEQRWKNVKLGSAWKIISWLPSKIGSVFSNNNHYKYKQYNAGSTGFIVFNQPKYKLTDTVKLKAYIINKHRNAYKKPAAIFLSYYQNGQKLQWLKNIAPSSPGSFVFSFPLHDSLPNDKRMEIIFKNKKGRKLLSNTFSTEDYLLDEVKSYSVKSSADEYFSRDTIKIMASAKDANGLPVIDGKAQLILLPANVFKQFGDSVYVPDTLFTETKELAADEETVFSIPVSILPKVNMSIDAKVYFANSNNEMHTETETFKFTAESKMIFVQQSNGYIHAEYRVNGQSVSAQGVVSHSYQEDKGSNIVYPADIKIDPMEMNYVFYVKEKGVNIDSARTDINDNYNVSFSRFSIRDSIGFVLSNPYKIPVYYTIFFGNTVVASGMSDESRIVWSKKENNGRKIYRVTWQYYWSWDEIRKEDKIYLLSKLLNIEASSQTNVFPGQRDTISLKVTDYKNKPAENVNITAVSYNNQFSNIRVKEPPYLVKYHAGKYVKRDSYDYDDVWLVENYPIGRHKAWLKKLGADTMLNYKTLFPDSGFLNVAASIDDFIPQAAVHITDNGKRREVILLYVNNKLVYYTGVTDKMPYSFSSMEGYTKIAVRLTDKLLVMDSIYLQPFYKHDLFIDISNLPHHAQLFSMTNYFTNEERNLLENSLWQLNSFGKNNHGFVWQNNSLAEIKGGSNRLAGPFKSFDSLHFYSPGDFDIHFIFEPGYSYRLSDKIERLEKRKVFPEYLQQVKITEQKNVEWAVGNTILPLPKIEYTRQPEIYLPHTDNKLFLKQTYSDSATGHITIHLKSDSIIKYVILYPPGQPEKFVIADTNTSSYFNLLPGLCSILFVTRIGYVSEKQFMIVAGKTLYIKFSSLAFSKSNEKLDSLLRWRSSMFTQTAKTITSLDQSSYFNSLDTILPYRFLGSNAIQGKVIDAKGKLGIAYATVNIKGTKTAIATKADGSFVINRIKPGTYTLVISVVGYESTEVTVEVLENNVSVVSIEVKPMALHLDEVVVTALGLTKNKKSLGYSTVIVSNNDLLQAYPSPTFNFITGKAAGVSVYDGDANSATRITLRGTRSLLPENRKAYIIDGILYDSIPSNITPDMIEKIEVLNGSEAVGIYGSSAADGAYIISTKIKTTRNQFKDYALWQPEVFTDKNGETKIAITYPDNITSWQTNILAIDRKNRVGKKQFLVTAYKPLLAKISSPQFLIAGDTSFFVGKATNYTKDSYSSQTVFSLQQSNIKTSVITIPASESIVQYFPVETFATDSIHYSFSLQTTTGFKDEEQKAIPVFARGLELSEGIFRVINSDTIISYTSAKNGELHLYAEAKTLDMMLEDIDRLQKYPYACIEQSSSKLRGLLMEKQIREALSQKFEHQKIIDALLKKILNAQLYDGSWSWWQNGKANLRITNYTLRALLPLRGDALVENAIRNSLLYLQNSLSELHKDELLETLSTMSMAHHALNYQPWLAKINFDSLSNHGQWQYVSVLQNLQLPYDSLLQKLIAKGIGTATGGLHYGEENYSWYSNDAATTVIAYNVIKQNGGYKNLLPSIYQYFMERKKSGYYTNTVETASILSSILPDVLADNKNFNTPAALKISGDTSCTITAFPAKLNFSNTIRQLQLQKTNGALLYCTLYKNYFEPQPKTLDSLFAIATHFEKNNRSITNLTAGQTTNFVIELNVKKDAEYVMLEVPIPAGCTYNEKNIYFAGMNAEYFKNKIVLFAASLAKGSYTYTVSLQPRYSGHYTINPAKASLMYFPVLYGCNETTNVEIKNKE